MKFKDIHIIYYISYFIISACYGQDTINPKLSLDLSGQLSGWGQYNPSNTMDLSLGKRYIIQLNSKYFLAKEKLFDIEGSCNLLSMTEIRLSDSVHFDWDAKLYRLWARYSTKQTELRLGLQKINFGSAMLLRPLMWFDQLDPRDPQQLTNGIWGILGRYYFLNNTNIWLWGLYGNKEQRPWDLGVNHPKSPEFGSRIQFPLKKGEIGLSYHHRNADLLQQGGVVSQINNIPENRYGLDVKFDVIVGIWCEAAWINKRKDAGMLTHQQMTTIGSDYTFGIGNGLNIVFEHMIFSTDKKAFDYLNTYNFSSFSISYPLSIDDHVQYISFYDWKNKAIYNFLNYKHQFGVIASHLMLYYNPEKYNLPQQGSTGHQFAGKGIQLMLIYNH